MSRKEKWTHKRRHNPKFFRETPATRRRWRWITRWSIRFQEA